MVTLTKSTMPMRKGCSSKVRSQNISELRRSGRELDQAIAIAMDFARKQGCKIKRRKKK